MKFYISGKIGEDNPSPETLAKFKKAEDMLEDKGHEVFNPTSEEWQNFLLMNWSAAEPLAVIDKYTYILLKDIQKLTKCDAVLVLPDWHQSPGAKVEMMLAMASHKPIYQEAPNGRLFEVKFDVRKKVYFEEPENAMTVGELKKGLSTCRDEDPVMISADFILGPPFEESFGKQIHGNVNGMNWDCDMKSPTGRAVMLESFFTCNISFD